MLTMTLTKYNFYTILGETYQSTSGRGWRCVVARRWRVAAAVVAPAGACVAGARAPARARAGARARARAWTGGGSCGVAGRCAAAAGTAGAHPARLTDTYPVNSAALYRLTSVHMNHSPPRRCAPSCGPGPR